MPTSQLRETKKAHTRQVIADVAAGLFHAHGFDAVTVEEIAHESGVSKKTVFNYFPTKEDLFFYRTDHRAGRLLAAVHARDESLPVVESFRLLCLEQVRLLPSLRAEAAGGGQTFFDLVAASPALQRKAHEVNAELTETLAQALADQAGLPVGDPVATVVASALIAAQRTLYLRLRRQATAPITDATVIRRHRSDTNRIFDQLRDGLANYPSRHS